MYIEEQYCWKQKNILKFTIKLDRKKDLIEELKEMAKPFLGKQLKSPLIKIPISCIFEGLDQNEIEIIECFFSLKDSFFETYVEQKGQEQLSNYYKICNLTRIIIDGSDIEDGYKALAHYVNQNKKNALPYIYQQIIEKNGKVTIRIYIEEKKERDN